MVSLAVPLPIKHAAVAQAAAAGLMIATTNRRQQLSHWLCPLSAQRYISAASVVSAALACVLPAPLGIALLSWKRQITGGRSQAAQPSMPSK